MLKVPFCFIEEDLIESLKINKNDLGSVDLITDPNLFEKKFTLINNSENLGLLDSNCLADYNFVKNDVFSGIDWIYSFVESAYAYNFRIFYYKYYNTFFDDSCDYFYNLFWFFTINTLSFQLF